MIRRRNEFTAQTKRDAYARSNGICECHLIPHVFPIACGRALGQGNQFFEHVDPEAICGSNDLSNCAVLCKTCWTIKTLRYDRKVIAKNNHSQDRARGIKPRSVLPGSRSSAIKLRMNKSPVYRDSGKPLLQRPWVKQLCPSG